MSLVNQNTAIFNKLISATTDKQAPLLNHFECSTAHGVWKSTLPKIIAISIQKPLGKKKTPRTLIILLNDLCNHQNSVYSPSCWKISTLETHLSSLESPTFSMTNWTRTRHMKVRNKKANVYHNKTRPLQKSGFLRAWERKMRNKAIKLFFVEQRTKQKATRCVVAFLLKEWLKVWLRKCFGSLA